MVFGPANVPKVLDAGRAREDLSPAAMSTIPHAGAPDAETVMEALAKALLEAPDEAGFGMYAELVERGLGKSRAAVKWRVMMSVDPEFFRSETSQRLRAEGLEQGLERGLEQGRRRERARNIHRDRADAQGAVECAGRRRVLACEDEALLDLWFDRSLSAGSGAELLGEG